jgi:hypothetical protein
MSPALMKSTASLLACCNRRRLQEDARLRQQLGGTLAFANQLVESIAFLRVEPDHVFLDGNLFPGHESPPSLPCRDRDSEIPVRINDGGD